MNTNLEELENYLKLIAPDPALKASFRAQNPILCDLFRDIIADKPERREIGFTPFPTSFAAMQVTVFDNWGGPKPPKDKYPFARYGMDVKVWETAPQNKRAWHSATVFWACQNLWQRKDAVSKARRLIKRGEKNIYPVDPVVADDLATLREDGHANMGILHNPNVKGVPIRYFASHYVTMSFVDGEPTVGVYLPHGFFTLTKLSRLDANGVPLNANPKLARAIGQARIAMDPSLKGNAVSGWAAGESSFVGFR